MANHSLALAPDIAEIPRLLDWVEACCAGDGVADGVACQLALAIEEAVANVVNHGFHGIAPPHRIAVRLDIGAGKLTAEIVDNGAPFDPSAAPEPESNLPLEQRDPGGLGIRLIHRMADRIEYRRAAGENRLRLEKTLG